MPDDRIPRQKLGPIIDEIDQLEQEAAEQPLDREEVRDVLQQLSVPTHRLDEAVARVDAREAELAQKKATRRKLFLGVGAFALLVSLGVSTVAYTHTTHASALAAVTASDPQISVAGSPLPAGTPMHHGAVQDVQLDVVLHDVPTGDKLDMSCDWIGPTGQVVYESHYQTKSIDRALWPTHCKYPFKTTAPTGPWSVKMKLAERVVMETPFTID